MNTDAISEIIRFWHGPALDKPEAAFERRDWWYKGGAPVDDEIRTRFGDLVEKARDGGLNEWRDSSEGVLALIILLDQFTRNLYRNTVEAYSGDARAFEVMALAIRLNLDKSLHPVSRIWLYHPFHHSEDVVAQDTGITILKALKRQGPAPWRPFIQQSVKGWTRHRDIVARFGRFPHRNHVLGRPSSRKEVSFLTKNGESFGQGPKRRKDPTRSTPQEDKS
jgi:uncharacterized protein (DUF924 family)